MNRSYEHNILRVFHTESLIFYAGHDGGTLTDSIIVFNINPKKRQVVIITVPRDTWVKIPIRSDISKNFKINHAYAIGLSDTAYPLKEPQYRGEEKPANENDEGDNEHGFQ